MLLATDLDGTFLGGKMEDRLNLYKTIKKNKDIKLVFVTGRGLESVIPLLNDPIIPTPDYIIADVGSTLVNGRTLESIEPIQGEIEAKWPSVYKIQHALADITTLQYQDVPQQRRCSYYYNGDTDLNQVKDIAERFGCEVITSVDKYLDLLPKDVNKGSTLLKLTDYLHISPEEVLVAGDTLNDLSLYGVGFHGVAVGGSEIGLVNELKDNPMAYLAESKGAGGILECIMQNPLFKKFIDQEKERIIPKSSTSKNQLVMVYHRLPFERTEVNGEIIRSKPKSPNGIIPSLLGLFEKGRSGIWIGEEVYQEGKEPYKNEMVDVERYPNLMAATISLSKKDIDQFYRVFSKEAFWPTIFSFVEKAKFNYDDWEHYLKINRIFAERIAQEADEGALVWIHEYNLWMVPAFLKPLRPDLKIGFFHHTAFPAADIFNILPWRREIIGSLLLCDFISFHIPRYVENFIDVLRSHTPFKVLKKVSVAKQFLTYSSALGVEQMTKLIEVDGRKIRLGAQPVGINFHLIEKILQKKEIQEKISHFKEDKERRGVKRIVSIERLDYVKGPLEKIKAFGAFLKEYPEYRGKVELVNVCTPPSQGMKIYDQIQDKVNQAIGEINGKYATMDWTPIQYFFQALPFEDVIIQYAVSDIAWITPLRDGLNLVAKEYVATQGLLNGNGVLVLSEFAGASVELPYSIFTNPYDRVNMVSSLLKALVIDPDEASIRLKRSLEQIKHYDIHYWGTDFVKELEKSQEKVTINNK